MRPRKAVSPERLECAFLFWYVCCVCHIAFVLCHTCPLLSVAPLPRFRARSGSVKAVPGDVGTAALPPRVSPSLPCACACCCTAGCSTAAARLQLSACCHCHVLTPARGRVPSARLPLCAAELSWIPCLLSHRSLTDFSSSASSLPQGVCVLPHPARHQSLFQCTCVGFRCASCPAQWVL